MKALSTAVQNFHAAELSPAAMDALLDEVTEPEATITQAEVDVYIRKHTPTLMDDLERAGLIKRRQ